MSSTTIGASPRLISSHSNTDGFDISPRPIATIRTIHAEGVGIIWIEHVVHALLAVVQRLIVLDFGRVVAQGAPAEVMRSNEVQTIYMGVPA